ncbi:SAVED domain-containing protein [Pseudomonas syringae]|uniref:SAVED domain-containing protein n=1 Tax=Pseudomonas syringae TaxID=317 RepID=UPI003F7AC7E8
MSEILKWAMGLGSLLVGYWVRKRNVGLAIMATSAGVIASQSAGNFDVEAQHVFGLVEVFKFSTSGGLDALASTVMVYLGAIGFLAGGYIVLRDWHADRKERDSRRVAVIEFRGLVDTSDNPLASAVPARIVGRRDTLLRDQRTWLNAKPPSIQAALDDLVQLPRDLRVWRADNSRANVQVVAGGMMPVSLQFYAGMLLDDEGQLLAMDWDRTREDWRELTEPDLGIRFDVQGLDYIKAQTDVVLAVSASYHAEFQDIEKAFPGLSIVHLERPDPTVNTIWSDAEVRALKQQFTDTLCRLGKTGVSMVHLVLAAPFSVSFGFGRAYDPRNMPPLRCYQWNRTQTPPYPWAIEMPRASGELAKLVTHQQPAPCNA